MENKFKDILCYAPFCSTHIRYNAYSICCASSYEKPINLSKAVIEFNNPFYRKLRKAMLGFEKLPYECQNCLYYGFTTKQFSSVELNKIVKTNLENMDENYQINEFMLGYLFLDLDRICNLSCRICSSLHSTKYEYSIGKEAEEIFKSKSVTYAPNSWLPDLLLNLDKSALLGVEIQGGEPFLSPHFKWLIDCLPNIPIRIVTNGMVYNVELLQAMRAKFDDITILYSIDGDYKTQNYSRCYARMDEIEKNIEKINEYVDYSIMNITISKYNIGNIEGILAQVYRIERILTDIDFHFVLDNNAMRISSLRSNEKKKIIEEIKKIVVQGKFAYQLNVMLDKVILELVTNDTYTFEDEMHFEEFNSCIDKKYLGSLYDNNKSI